MTKNYEYRLKKHKKKHTYRARIQEIFIASLQFLLHFLLLQTPNLLCLKAQQEILSQRGPNSVEFGLHVLQIRNNIYNSVDSLYSQQTH